MNKEFARGLVVGKFSPLHKGHELVIERALELCREVILVSYSNPELPGCDATRRERWLAELYPQARRLVVTNERLQEWLGIQSAVPEIPPNAGSDSVHRRFVGLLCREVLGVTVDAVFTSEDYGDGFAAELTRFFQEHDRATPEVRHILVDRARSAVPISGSQIRSAVHTHRQWLAPAVYASFVQRVCLLGGESSGKSTLAQILAERFVTAHVPEYGRELWELQGGMLHYEDLLRIAQEQVAREEAAARAANRFLFCDTSPLTTLLYSMHLFGRAEAELLRLAGRIYEHVVLCAPDFPFRQDGTRQESAFRDLQHAWYREELERRRMPYQLVDGSIERRVAAVAAALRS